MKLKIETPTASDPIARVVSPPPRLPAIIVLAMPMTGTVMLETMFGSASRRISRFINEGFNVSQR